MTLVIAGFNKGSLNQGSLYLASDGNITDTYCGEKRLLIKGFKKVVEIPIRIMQPIFVNGAFVDYKGFVFESRCVIAFAGSTLVSQHFLNSITNHLSNLRPYYSNKTYQLVMSCEEDLKSKPSTTMYDTDGDYGEPMFTRLHISTLGSAEYFSEVVEHSIDAVLKKVRTYTNVVINFDSYKVEFILGVYCHQKNEHQLYTYEIVKDDKLDAIVKKSQVGRDDIALIGDKSFKKDALNAVSQSTDINGYITKAFNDNEGSNTEAKAILKANELAFDFLNKTIDTENSKGNITIGKPSVLYEFERGSLTRTKFIAT